MEKIVTFLCVFGILLSCKDKVSNQEILADGNYKVNGSVKGMDNGNLYLVDGTNTRKIEVTDGKFTITGKMDGIVEKKQLYLKEPLDFETPLTIIYLEPNAMELIVSLNDSEATKLVGSKTQDEFYNYQTGKRTIEGKYQKKLNVIDQYYAKSDSIRESEEQDLVEIKRINATLDSLENEVEPYYVESKSYMSKFVKRNPDSYFALYLIQDMMMGSFDGKEVDSLFGSLSIDLQNSMMGRGVVARMKILQKGTVGELAEDFTTIDINGKPLSLSNYKGQYVLLDFWASWCKPCRDGNPHLLKLYKKYSSKGLEIIGISDDEERPKIWNEAVKKDRIGVWKHVLRGNSKEDTTKVDIAKLYNVAALPTKILIDPEGKIVFSTTGGGTEDNAFMDVTFEEIFGN